MRILNITEVLLLEENETVMGVTGVVDSVYEQNSGTNEHGEWTLQNLMLKDAKDPKVKIKVKVAEREAMAMNCKGKHIWFICTQNSKGTWTGLKIKNDTYKGKTSKILSCTATAEISFSDPGTGQAPPPAEQPADRANTPPPHAHGPTPHNTAAQAPAQAPAAQTPQAPHRAPAPPPPADDKAAAVAKTRIALGSAANSYWLCLLAGEYNFKRYQAHTGEPMTEGQFQAMVSSMFIWLDHQGLVGSLPAGDITAYLPQPKQSNP